MSTVLYTVTDPVTALSLMRGQFRALREEGFEPHLACGVTPELEEFAATEGVVLHDVPLTRSWLSVAEGRSFVRAVRVLRRVRPDVLNYSTPKAAALWAIASWCARPPKVVFLLRGLRLEGERPWSPAFVLLWLMELVAARSAHTTVAVSETLRDRAIALHLVRRDRTVVLGAGSSNGVDLDRFSPVTPPERERARARLGLPPSTFVVGFVGRLAADKGLSDLLEAVDSCVADVDLACVLVGPSEPDLDLEAVLGRLPNAASVTVVRPASKSVEDEYAAFDLFVLPSHREGLSNALLEAQARGLPCLTTDATGCVDAITLGVTGVVVPAGSPQRLADAIRQAADPHERSRLHAMGVAGRGRVERHFRQTDVWARYVELYRLHVPTPEEGVAA